MPLYEYRCDRCTMVFEELVLSSSHAARCPVCAGRDVTRMLSTFAARGGGAAEAASGAGAAPGVPARTSGGGCCGGACGCGH